ncbi:peptidoglycan editing factor PgeF [Ferrimonas pelagia]|uniref:Purine nucleoside phosphorylase n=1 Tax=Ferrimonas pelagia TaxID=1177826 RepID=A0ABP9ES28_9GAMM
MWLTPDWPAPATVLALSTTRFGGASSAPYAGLNLGQHVGDRPEIVEANRARLSTALPDGATIQWLDQVHGTDVVSLPTTLPLPQADASFTDQANQYCAVMTADCLPVLLCDRAGTQVAAVHAGWRGLHAGVIEACLARFQAPASQILAWLGPAIGPNCFEVGAEVRAAFVAEDRAAEDAFLPQGDRYLADIYQLARLRLQRAGVSALYGDHYCTASDPSRFYSYRRQGRTGRQASLIGLRRQA